MTINLQDLLPKHSLPKEIASLVINDLAIDSRKIKPGALFLAYQGTHNHGGDYVAAAIKNGAIAIIIDAEYPNLKKLTDEFSVTPIIPVNHLIQEISAIAGRFYHQPSHQLDVIGVTGTNGKTSSTHYIAQLVEQLGTRCGIMGTVGQGFCNQLLQTGLTTVDPLTIQHDLAHLLQQGAKVVAMEVTSHGIVQHRVENVQFTLAAFTNLTRDHLDYHGNMESYGAAKAKLFQYPGLRYAVINLDDPFSDTLLKVLSADVQVLGYSLAAEKNSKKCPIIWLENIVYLHNGMTATLHTPWGVAPLQVPLLGRFNLSNMLLAIGSVLLSGYSLNAILSAVPKLKGVAGRMQCFGGSNNKPTVIVDYAHTPDGLQQALSSLKEHCKGKLWCIFGCGGDRDRGKRPLMAQAVESNQAQLIITNDNPRTEDPLVIINDILTGVSAAAKPIIEPDRTKAIQIALAQAKPEDIIVVAGKGHEDYQILGTKRVDYSDIETVQRLLA